MTFSSSFLFFFRGGGGGGGGEQLITSNSEQTFHISHVLSNLFRQCSMTQPSNQCETLKTA